MPVLAIHAMVPVMLIAVPARAAGQQTLLPPYREQQSSEIRGLSAEEIEDLRAGRGVFEQMSQEARRLGGLI